MRGNLVVGMLANVDAGKTTLSEGMLYKSGYLKRIGRVDHKDAFLDTDAMEKKRGITIFSKQAVMSLGDMSVTLLDTPGHVDFSSEMERVLHVLDYAVLVISAQDGVQGHTRTLWELLERYEVPAFLFVNKMDLDGTNKTDILCELTHQLHPGCISFSNRQEDAQSFQEEIAMCDEQTLNQYLECGYIDEHSIITLISRRLLFPCYFGAALKLDGIESFLLGLERYTRIPDYHDEFSARVYKVSRDAQNQRLTHLKVTGGCLEVKAALCGEHINSGGASEGVWTEKVNQIRIYSGEKYQATERAEQGMVCAVTGLNHTYAGQGLGKETAAVSPALEPVLTYRVNIPEGSDPYEVLRRFRQLEEEDPLLAVSWIEQTKEIRLNLMGEIQLEILRHIVTNRFGLEVTFDAGSIIYKETITESVIGVGHYEPLRHYAEVQLLLEPGPRGSGLNFGVQCGEDELPRNWQRLVLTHLEEKEHIGVLTGSPITDIKITLLSGRAHNKHTDGGDFRYATYRAVRQGLMRARSILLEPWYRFRLVVPNQAVGRAMNDLQRMTEDLSLPDVSESQTVLNGSAPVVLLRKYAPEVAAYTHGCGRLSCTFIGYAPCHNQEEVISAIGYDSLGDYENPADSIFCSHGASIRIRWDQVLEYMHTEYRGDGTVEEMAPKTRQAEAVTERISRQNYSPELDEELREIYERTYGPIKRRVIPQQKQMPRDDNVEKTLPQCPSDPLYDGDYLLIDGYNLIFAWEDLNAVARQNLDAARQILMDILSNYQGFRKREIILVFDAYKVPGRTREIEHYNNINVVYTKEAETADAYIEKVTYKIGSKRRVTVVTSDRAIQLIIWGHGALRLSPNEFRAEIKQTNADISDIIRKNNSKPFSPSNFYQKITGTEKAAK